MGTILTTKDGENHTILSDSDFIDLINDYIGHDARIYFDNRFKGTVELLDFLNEITDSMFALDNKLESLVDHQHEIQKRTLQKNVKEIAYEVFEIFCRLQTYDTRI